MLFHAIGFFTLIMECVSKGTGRVTLIQGPCGMTVLIDLLSCLVLRNEFHARTLSKFDAPRANPGIPNSTGTTSSRQSDMDLTLSTWLVYVAAAYLAAGVLFAIPFAARLVNRLDPEAAEGSRGFRLIIVPGVIMLWPIMLRRLISGVSNPPEERSPHRSVKS